jgi:TRAP transporter 4TM/12TM fusion protein
VNRRGARLVDLLFSVGARRKARGWVAWVVPPFAFAIALWVIYAAMFAIIDPWTLTSTFFGAMITLVFLSVGATQHIDEDRLPVVDLILAALALACGIYFALRADYVVTRIALLDELTPWDMMFGSIAFFLTLEATRRTTGLGLLIVVLIFVAYNFLGHLLPGALGHGYIDYNHFIDIMVYTTDGIMGLPLRVAATYAFLFVMFGSILAAAGGSEFFFNIAAAVSGRSPGGPAKIAVVSSGLYGTISGSPTADVVTTGAITIPMMRRLGYSGVLAGAVEVAASTGGSVLPPVMGSAAFIMAEYIGVDYRDIAIAAILPALLYYVGVYAQVHFRSLKLGLRGMDSDQIPGLGATLRDGGLFFVPLVVLTVALLLGYSPNFVAIFGTLSVIGVAAVRRATRVGLVGLYRALADTTLRTVAVAGACAAAGMVIAGITMTGLAGKFSHLMFAVTGASLFPSLLFAAGLTILLGCGMPTPSAYILAAVLVGPLLVDLHVAKLTAHMFLLYYAVMSALTPPVAVAAYAAAPLAEANPLGIAAGACRFALAAFIVPFFFVYGPELLLMGSVFQIVAAAITAVIGVVMLAIAAEGYWRGPLRWWSRLLALASGLCFVAPSLELALVGAALAVGALGSAPILRRLGLSTPD